LTAVTGDRIRAVAVEVEDDGAVQELTMDWVSVPELEVATARQVYESGRPTATGGAQIGFASDGFAEHIHVDCDGVVIDYPSIAQRIA
jgi:hypothetical protein